MSVVQTSFGVRMVIVLTLEPVAMVFPNVGMDLTSKSVMSARPVHSSKSKF